MRNGQLRIIGGKWRGRKISFAQAPDLRPSPDRVRETLFNWLQSMIPGATCLELYAGSGILSLEALSRGARQVTLVEKLPSVHRQLQTTFDTIQAQNYSISCSPAADFVHDTVESYDIVFLDPPFDSDELSLILPMLGPIMHEKSYVYVETNREISDLDGFSKYRGSRAGKVYYYLFTPLDVCR
jgi:16S rRNA (guanine966-N2)-methyltransferase